MKCEHVMTHGWHELAHVTEHSGPLFDTSLKKSPMVMTCISKWILEWRIDIDPFKKISLENFGQN